MLNPRTEHDFAYYSNLVGSAKIESAFEMSSMQRGRLPCYMDEIQLLRRLGEGRRLVFPVSKSVLTRGAPARRSQLLRALFTS
jgi:hypothetical protein